MVARLQPGDPFFSYRQKWFLSYHQLNSAHKKVGKAFDLPQKRFSCKSSRVGGACALSLSGFPDSYIKIMGRWASLSFLHYVRLCVTAYSKGLAALSNPKLFTVTDVKKLLPTHASRPSVPLLRSADGAFWSDPSLGPPVKGQVSTVARFQNQPQISFLGGKLKTFMTMFRVVDQPY